LQGRLRNRHGPRHGRLRAAAVGAGAAPELTCEQQGAPIGTRRAAAALPARALLIAAALLASAAGIALRVRLTARAPAGAIATRVAATPAQRSLALSLQGELAAAISARDRAYQVYRSAGDLRAANPGQHLALAFGRTGLRVSSGAIWARVDVRDSGYGTALTPLARVAPHGRANRVTYLRAGLREWYRNGPLGLEQGFTIARPRVAAPAGTWTLSLALSSDARLSLSDDAKVLTLAFARQRSLRYGSLRATDARGRELGSWLSLARGRLLLHVDARAATYPIRIDPIVQQAEALPGGGSGKFGSALALSADGRTAIAGAPEQEGGEAPEHKEGVVYAFTRSGMSWSQQGSALTTPREIAGGAFGTSVALSANGNTALIGSPQSRAGAGLAWIFTRSGSTWSESERLRDNGAEREHEFGSSVALSADASTAVVAAEGADRRVSDVIFVNSGSGFSAEQRIENVHGAIALSADGSTLLIGAHAFVRSGSSWAPQGAPLSGSNQVGQSGFGESVALSADGSTALIGGPEDNSCASCGHSSVGAVWVFTRSGSTWTQQGEKLVASGAEPEGHFGESVALSVDGNTALVGAPGNGKVEPTEAGAVFAFTRSGSSWTQRGEFRPSGAKWSEELENGSPEFGASLAVSASGHTVLIGADDFESGGASVAVASPEVTGVSPAAGPHTGGTPVTVSGANFDEASAVHFGGAPASSFTVTSDTSITASAPPGAGAVDVTVTVPGTGTSAISAADEFSYTEVPEVGHCEPSARRKGEYKVSNCTKPARGKGSYDWHRGAGAASGFKGVLSSPSLQTTGPDRLAITCASGQSEGRFAGTHALAVTSLRLLGCTDSSSPGVKSDCQTTGSANGEIVAAQLAGEVGFVAQSRKRATVGVDLAPTSGPNLASFECGGASESTGKGSGAGTPMELQGSVIGEIATINAMTASDVIAYQASAGRQVPERLEGGLTDVLTALVGLAATPEPTAFSAREEIKFEQPLEISTSA
jgi:hypothetical protein